MSRTWLAISRRVSPTWACCCSKFPSVKKGFSCHCCPFEIRLWLSVKRLETILNVREDGEVDERHQGSTRFDMARISNPPGGPPLTGGAIGGQRLCSLNGRTAVMTQTSTNGWKSKIKETVLCILWLPVKMQSVYCMIQTEEQKVTFKNDTHTARQCIRCEGGFF